MEETMLLELRERLGSELERLARELTVAVPAGGAGDVEVRVSPPAGEREREVRMRVRRLGQFVAGLAKLDPSTLWYDRAGFGSSVVLQNLDTRERVAYTLVTGEMIDLDEDQVTLASPIGQAVLGRRAGDRVAVDTPQGKRRFRIVSVETLPQVAGLGGAPATAAGAQ
ncbi:MAG TPA: GreA/GreB family elongation factor [Longimicrobiaceae bacterium]|jgi:transcription elongation factor GreA